MPRSVDQPDELMGLESASSSDDSEDEDDDHVLDNVEAGLAEEARPPKSTTARKLYSIAHEDIVGKRVVYIHIDIEHGGPKCGMVSILVVFMDADLNIIGEFDEFIRPPDTAEWDDNATRVHGYHKNHASIVSAKPIVEVWARFKSSVESYSTKPNTVGMMLAWNGKASDCSKLFELTEVEYRGTLFMPDGVMYFADPMIAISGYKRNELNETKRRPGTPLGYGLGVVYEYMFEERLVGAHNSLVDAKAQARIFADPRVQSYFRSHKSCHINGQCVDGEKETRVRDCFGAFSTSTIWLGRRGYCRECNTNTNAVFWCCWWRNCGSIVIACYGMCK